MHDTPSIRTDETWQMQFEVKQAWKSKSTGWMYSDDTYAGRNGIFDSLEGAIAYCRRHGIAFQVEVPRKRKNTWKSYAHNFLWKGEPEVDSEDVEN